jgi:type 1 glutamine amidotransferase
MTFMSRSYSKLFSSFLLVASTLLVTACLGAGPNAPMPKAEVLKLTGSFEDAKLSRDINILWLYGPEDHGGGEHDYIRIKDLFVPLLKEIPRVSVDEAFNFPSKAQFDKADLLIQFLHMPALSDEQYKTYQAFVDGGGGVVSIHESCIMRPLADASKYAECIGCGWKGNKSSKWSKFDHDTPLYLKTDHAAFAGLPRAIKFSDESYWNMSQRDAVEVIGVIAPETEKAFADVEKVKDTRGQAFWTYTSGKGRVFGTTTGHYSYTYHDPIYRILLMRGIAWAIKEKPAPFMPIVFAGITDEKGLVGTKDSMRKYKNRKK